MEGKYLPIGTVCTLKGKSKKVMIAGYYSVKFNGNLKINDYIGLAYPEGLLVSDQNFSFNHSDIENVEFLGYKNSDYYNFSKIYNGLMGNVTEEEKIAEQYKEPRDVILTSGKSYSKLIFDENGVVIIAEPIVKNETTRENEASSTIENQKPKLQYEFDENGVVTKVINPFHKTYEDIKEDKSDSKNWNVFKKNQESLSDNFGKKSKKKYADDLINELSDFIKNDKSHLE